LLSSLLYGVKPSDPSTFIAVSLILTVAALAALLHPCATSHESRSHGGLEA